MRIGILGSGLMGGKLGTIFARARLRRRARTSHRLWFEWFEEHGS